MEKSLTLKAAADEPRTQAERANMQQAVLTETACGWSFILTAKKAKRRLRKKKNDLPEVLLEGIKQTMQLLVETSGATSEVMTATTDGWTYMIQLRKTKTN